MSSWIKIGKATLRGNRIENEITFSRNLKRFFKYRTFYAEYDEQLEENPSILNIPAVASLISLAWVTSAELRVDDLDSEFIQSIRDVYREYNKMHPAPLLGRLTVRRAWLNKPSGEGLALFFSGGLDSQYSLFQLRDRGPRLIMIKGFDYYFDDPLLEGIWKRWKKTYTPFACTMGLTLNFIETNSRAIMREGAVNALIKARFKMSIWDSLRHAVLLIALAAPLSRGRFNELIVSASRTPALSPYLHPYASNPITDEMVKYAGLRVTHYGQIQRFEKMHALVEPLREGLIQFRSCYKVVLDGLNCNTCGKCGRLICFLLREGLDPNDHGFVVDDETLPRVRRDLELGLDHHLSVEIHWGPWRDTIPQDLSDVPDLYGIREFMKWIRTFDSEEMPL